eukprot:CAMPEP_0171860532 /NCGR_PEP_ID=MMETSP0992-20121227/26541_1 /TAXON_ID=483369 /ORGANISM="non described non described, Strain CCMP2098" /LENGTH=157 /DNA_ID=CAMNT_0012482377 /DNA_START=68 /DNA_END=538 /DNA_ORIENTATION=+
MKLPKRPTLVFLSPNLIGTYVPSSPPPSSALFSDSWEGACSGGRGVTSPSSGTVANASVDNLTTVGAGDDAEPTSSATAGAAVASGPGSGGGPDNDSGLGGPGDDGGGPGNVAVAVAGGTGAAASAPGGDGGGGDDGFGGRDLLSLSLPPSGAEAPL